jgi:hypothetical protein
MRLEKGRDYRIEKIKAGFAGDNRKRIILL